VQLSIRVLRAQPMASHAPVQIELEGFSARTQVTLDPLTAPANLAAALSTGPPGLVVAAATQTSGQEPAQQVLVTINEPPCSRCLVWTC
jgi:hypothetical protein